ncbi:MAG: hypothetical protein MK132_18155 [Lentisphaerales bacterium]|nr:hypothetical protein [Lentisphaerales bacterium]
MAIKKFDIIAGAAEGFVHTMSALENGNFTRSQRLKDRSGKEIRLGNFYNVKIDGWDKDPSHMDRDGCLYPTAVDWDNDGDLLLAGHSSLVAVRIKAPRKRPVIE